MKSALSGKKVVVTRAAGAQADEIVFQLERRGATAICIPAIQIESPESYQELDRTVEEIDRYDWILFTSVNGVSAFHSRFREKVRDDVLPQCCRLAAVGEKTATVVRELFRSPDLVPAKFIGRAIADDIGDVEGQRILLPRGNLAGGDLVEGLISKGALVDSVCCYRTIPGCDEGGKGEVESWKEDTMPDVLSFTSPSTVTGLLELFRTIDRGELFQSIPIVCIGPVTAARVVELGGVAAVVADLHTVEGLVAAIEQGVC